jgi:formamidopyrimidine-DNA glycosylase
MPELPEVEVLCRHLSPLLLGRRIEAVEVRRAKVLQPTSVAEFVGRLSGARFRELARRGKCLLFRLESNAGGAPFTMLGHLGLTGRMYLLPAEAPLPKHAPVVLGLGQAKFVFEDTRYFGRLTLDARALAGLGPEPLGPDFTAEYFRRALKRSGQAIKVKLLDQGLVAGVGNLYASEALFRAGISPRRPAGKLTRHQAEQLRQAVRAVLGEAIRRGSTVPLNWSGLGGRGRFFYYGTAPLASASYRERLGVYDRAGEPCRRCGTSIRRIVQAGRSTFFCPHCQRG